MKVSDFNSDVFIDVTGLSSPAPLAGSHHGVSAELVLDAGFFPRRCVC